MIVASDRARRTRRTGRPRRTAGLAGVAALVLSAVAALAGPAPVAAAVGGVAWPVQSLGDRGTDVLAIQRLLRARLAADDPSAPLPPANSVFGSTTATAIRAFQASRGLAATGIVDATTWGKLITSLSLGSVGEAVLALQVQLVEKRRVALPIDGTFGPSTADAVTAFQRHMGLPQTGIVNTAVWRALAWHYELPRFDATSLCDYSVGNGPANWGTAEAIDTTEAVGRTIVKLGYGRVAVGDVSREHGGDIAGHESHERGLDVDVRPMRRANDQCAIGGTRWSSAAYDRTATRALIKKFRAISPGHIKLIYFNDPVLIREGLTRWYSGHEDHLHVRFCEKSHPLLAYDC